MWKVLLSRWRQGSRTMRWPDGPPPPMPDRRRGVVTRAADRCRGCGACRDACPADAIAWEDDGRPGRAPRPEAGTTRAPPPGGARRASGWRCDLGRCVACGGCAEACPAGAVGFANAYRLAVRDRAALVVDGTRSWGGAPVAAAANGGAGDDDRAARLGAAFSALAGKYFGRSFKLRQVSAGGCNACEADANVLTTIGWDLSRFGIGFVASPRHADGLLVTGPVTANMREALLKTYEATPGPKVVVACGACAVSGGPWRGLPESGDGLAGTLPVDLWVPGCPPHPLTLLEGLLRLIGRIADEDVDDVDDGGDVRRGRLGGGSV